MITFGRLISKLLIWLTAIAMPLQVGWASDCGCASSPQGEKAVSSSPAPLGCCCMARASTPACRATKTTCCKASESRSTCCSRVAEASGCQCGPSCRCADHHESQPEPSAPAPENGRCNSEISLAVSNLAATQTLFSDDSSNHFVVELESSFSQPGKQLCVLLCRFTL